MKNLHKFLTERNQLSAEYYYPEIWDTMCSLGERDFKAKDVLDAWQTNLSRKTKVCYLGIILQYALAYPEDFSGPGSRLVRVTPHRYRLKDAPEQ